MVDEKLLYHDQLDIHKFSLNSDLDDNFISARHLNTWISFAVRHKVKDCKLVPSHEVVNLPGCLLTSTTLTALDLSSLDNLHWPETIHLPMLKVFKLDTVRTRLALYSEDLSISQCYFGSFSTFTISNHSLKHLLLLLTDYLEPTLSMPAAQSIKYFGLSPPKLDIENLSSVTCAAFEYNTPECTSEVPFFRSASEFLTGLLNVQNLNLCKGFILDPPDMVDTDKYLQLNEGSGGGNMKHLREITIWNFAGHETEVALVRYLLENTCILEEMDTCLSRELTKNADYKLKVLQQFSLFKVPGHGEA